MKTFLKPGTREISELPGAYSSLARYKKAINDLSDQYSNPRADHGCGSGMNGQRLLSRTHVLFYRLSRGRIGGRLWNAPVLLLTTVGRKTGKKRTTPLLYLRDGERLIIVASNGGRDNEPSWWTNLRHDPHAEVQIKGEKKKMIARKASEEENSSFWPLLTKMYPAYSDYQRRTKREIPVVILTEENL